ncbi:hypothetical protein LX32DRAFT_95311 [Colletotrichum zoysiae]|uniref:Uncharacterized protein n=1 Tax=Colletotrichum zoysiae TaxID=1216348 RepID=A0AAD9H992_9PEZI|nr:hypothetical protein LX32DRAFT_95311 [Colletotrichum zoysiae]
MRGGNSYSALCVIGSNRCWQAALPTLQRGERLAMAEHRNRAATLRCRLFDMRSIQAIIHSARRKSLELAVCSVRKLLL